jgi:hypothetical protein
MNVPHPNAGVKVSMNFNDRAFTEESVMDDVHRENIRMHLIPIQVFLNNMRTAGHSFTLDRKAVTLVREPSKLTDFSSTQQIIEQGYYPECAELVKKLTGADHVSCFGFAVRGGGDDSPAGKRKPVMNAHVDYTVDTVRSVAERIAPEQLKGRGYRFKAINVWRPIAPVETQPACHCRWLNCDAGRPLPVPDQLIARRDRPFIWVESRSQPRAAMVLRARHAAR